MGAVTGKGLSDLIREEYGLRITFLMMIGHSDLQFRERGNRVCRASRRAWNCSACRDIFQFRSARLSCG